MRFPVKRAVGRRSFVKHVATAFGAGLWAEETLRAVPQNVKSESRPSGLKITDMRAIVIGRSPMTCPIIRIDTNQGIYGLGEVRDGASKNYALMLKRRILGENPYMRRVTMRSQADSSVFWSSRSLVSRASMAAAVSR